MLCNTFLLIAGATPTMNMTENDALTYFPALLGSAGGSSGTPAPVLGMELGPEPGPLSGMELGPEPGPLSGMELGPEPGPLSGMELGPEPGRLSGMELGPEPGQLGEALNVNM